MNYWLMKSEPGTFSIDDLAKCPDQTEPWDGIRNYQARNFMRDAMKFGDQAFFYHSSCEIPAIVGIVRIVRAAYPDASALDPHSRYYDPKATPENPRWFLVDVKLVRRLKHPITLQELKACPELEEFPLVRRGNRLSIMPVSATQWRFILARE